MNIIGIKGHIYIYIYTKDRYQWHTLKWYTLLNFISNFQTLNVILGNLIPELTLCLELVECFKWSPQLICSIYPHLKEWDLFCTFRICSWVKIIRQSYTPGWVRFIVALHHAFRHRIGCLWNGPPILETSVWIDAIQQTFPKAHQDKIEHIIIERIFGSIKFWFLVVLDEHPTIYETVLELY